MHVITPTRQTTFIPYIISPMLTFWSSSERALHPAPARPLAAGSSEPAPACPPRTCAEPPRPRLPTAPMEAESPRRPPRIRVSRGTEASNSSGIGRQQCNATESETITFMHSSLMLWYSKLLNYSSGNLLPVSANTQHTYTQPCSTKNRIILPRAFSVSKNCHSCKLLHNFINHDITNGP